MSESTTDLVATPCWTLWRVLGVAAAVLLMSVGASALFLSFVATHLVEANNRPPVVCNAPGLVPPQPPSTD